MKNRSVILIIGIVLFLIIAAGAILIKGKKASLPGGSPQNPSTQSGPGQESIQSTLKDLLAQNIPQKCTFSDKSEDYDTSGTMYLSGNKMRGDFESEINGQRMISHMISKDDTSYNWQDGQTTGFMMKIDPDTLSPGDDEKNNGLPDSEKNQPIDPDKVVDYKCSPWNADNSLFNPPQNIKFTDYSSMMPPSAGRDTPNKQTEDPCSACDSLTGDAKSQCLSALNCS